MAPCFMTVLHVHFVKDVQVTALAYTSCLSHLLTSSTSAALSVSRLVRRRRKSSLGIAPPTVLVPWKIVLGPSCDCHTGIAVHCAKVMACCDQGCDPRFRIQSDSSSIRFPIDPHAVANNLRRAWQLLGSVSARGSPSRNPTRGWHLPAELSGKVF